MTEEELKNLQMVYVDIARDLLRTSGRVEDLGIILTKKTDIQFMIDNNIIDLNQLGFNLDQAVKSQMGDGTEYVAVVIDISRDPERLFKTICFIEPMSRGPLITAKNMALNRNIPEEHAYEIIMNQFFKSMDMVPKDIVIGAIKAISRKIAAFAAVLITGGHVANISDEDIDIEDKDKLFEKVAKMQTQEVIFCAMDAPNFRRVIHIPVFRNQTSGRLSIEFGELEECLDNKDGNNELLGPMVELLGAIDSSSSN